MMYYKVSLERVEVGKEADTGQASNVSSSLNEKYLEVIAPLDDEEEDNPFNINFEDSSH